MEQSSTQKLSTAALADFGRMIEALPVSEGAATTARREAMQKQISAARGRSSSMGPSAAMSAGLEALASQLPAGSKPLVMHAFATAMDVAAEANLEERLDVAKASIENGETFQMTLVAMKQYLELYAHLVGARSHGGAVRPIAVTLAEFEQSVPLLRRWGLQLGETSAEFAAVDKGGHGVVRFDDFAKWVMRTQLEALGTLGTAGGHAGTRRKPPPHAASLPAGTVRSSGALDELIAAGQQVSRRTNPPLPAGSRYGTDKHRLVVAPGSPPSRERSRERGGGIGGGGVGGGGASPSRRPTAWPAVTKNRTARAHKRSTVTMRPKTSKFDLAERLSDVGLQQYATRHSECSRSLSHPPPSALALSPTLRALRSRSRPRPRLKLLTAAPFCRRGLPSPPPRSSRQVRASAELDGVQ
jgi:hypothetical protein